MKGDEAVKDILVGTYDLGSESVDLILRPGTGGHFSTNSGSQGIRGKLTIDIGADETLWYQVFDSLLHEAKEACDMRMGCRFVPDIDYARDSAGYVFIETHAQHSEICARVGYLLAQCLPALERAWKKWQKDRKKEKAHA